MTEQQISILSLSILLTAWSSLGILIFHLLNKQTKEEYKKFYPHPLIGIIKDLHRDPKFKLNEIIWSSIILGIFWLPITPIWVILWLFYQLYDICTQSYSNSVVKLINKKPYVKPEISIKNKPTTLKDIYDKLPISIEEDTFLSCYRLVESELALDYFPLYYEEILNKDATGKIKYYDFEYNPIRIICVKSLDGKDLKFKLFPKSLKILAGEVENKVSIKYTHLPKSKENLDDESSYSLEEYFNIFTFGILQEYYLQLGDYDEANNYCKLYKKEISELYNSMKKE